jgi:hypothetical protein
MNIKVEIDQSGSRNVSKQAEQAELLKKVLDPSTPKSDTCLGTSPFNVSTPSDTSSSLEYSSSEGQECEGQVCMTENGALSYESSGDARLDLFFKTIRGMTRSSLYELLERSWAVSPRDTMRTMFYVRDCRGGKGERKIFVDFMIWLWIEHRDYFEKNLPCVPFYGCFKDLRKMMENASTLYRENGWFLESSFEKMIVSYWSDVLGKDVEAMNRGENTTLAAKWVDIQSGAMCREMKLSHKMFRHMVRLLRDKLEVVECKMSAGEWDKINFERICSLSMKRYSKAFQRHCQERFSEYLASVKKGEKKMNVGQLYPSDIAGPYLNSVTQEPTMDIAWEQLLIKCRGTLGKTNKKFICVVDTSGSMRGKPLEVAVSLGLFLSEIYPDSKFYRKFITFSQTPTLQEVTGDTLCDRIQSIGRANWEMNTNLQKTFELLLEQSTPEDHPDVVLILSDMQFDQSTKRLSFHWGDEDPKEEETTNLDEIENKYREKGLTRPRLVFWNLRANTIDFPATTAVRDCALVSGYSTSLMSALLEDGEISPMTLFRKTIDSPRYDLVYTQ